MFEPRNYQLRFLKAMSNGCRRAMLVWHRRAGKDITTWNWVITKALNDVGTYFYFFPTYRQGKMILWDGKDFQGTPFLRYIPPAIYEHTKFSETEMQITLPNESIIQIVGTDKYDYIMGTNPVGCVFSEFSLQDPRAWSYIQPILAENGGWAVFVFTPRGKNHAYDLFKEAEAAGQWPQGKWFTQVLTIDDTRREDGTPVVRREDIEERDEDIVQQEYYCSFFGAMSGSFYSELVKQAVRNQRVRPIEYDPELAVDTVWDVGHGDTTVIGFVQHIHNEVRWLDCYWNDNKGLPFFASVVSEKARQNGWRYGRHIFPHDMKVHDYGTGQQRIYAAGKLGLKPNFVAPKLSIEDGIDAVRRRFPKYWFNEASRGILKLLDALSEYHKEKDEKHGVWRNIPVHDWTSHFCDMVRYEAVSARNLPTNPDYYSPPEPITEFDPFALVKDEPEESNDDLFLRQRFTQDMRGVW